MPNKMEQTKVNVGISIKSKQEAMNLGLSFTEALEFGLAFKAAERDDAEYPRNILSRKIELLAARLAEAIERLEDMGQPPARDEKNYPENSYGN